MKEKIDGWMSKKQKETEKKSSAGNLNSFIVKSKKGEVQKKAMEVESEKKDKEKEEKREIIFDILHTVPRAK